MEYFDNKTAVLGLHVSRSLQSLNHVYLFTYSQQLRVRNWVTDIAENKAGINHQESEV